MFVIQRVLESMKFYLQYKNKVLQQHDFLDICNYKHWRAFVYNQFLSRNQQINQGQMDRWNIVSTPNYLPFEKELEIILAKCF